MGGVGGAAVGGRVVGGRCRRRSAEGLGCGRGGWAWEAPPAPPALPAPTRVRGLGRRSAHRRACGPAWRGRGTPPPQGSTPPSLRPGWWPPPPAPCRPPRRRRPPRPPPWPGRPATSPRRERARPPAPRRRTRGRRALGGQALGGARGRAQAQRVEPSGPRGAPWRLRGNSGASRG